MPNKNNESANRVEQINPIQGQKFEKISITEIQNLKNREEHEKTINSRTNSTKKDSKGSLYLNKFQLKILGIPMTSNENSLSSESNGPKSDKDEKNQQQSLEKTIEKLSLIRKDLQNLCSSDNTSSSDPVKKPRNTFGKDNDLANYRSNNFFMENKAPQDVSSVVGISYKKIF